VARVAWWDVVCKKVDLRPGELGVELWKWNGGVRVRENSLSLVLLVRYEDDRRRLCGRICDSLLGFRKPAVLVD